MQCRRCGVIKPVIEVELDTPTKVICYLCKKGQTPVTKISIVPELPRVPQRILNEFGMTIISARQGERDNFKFKGYSYEVLRRSISKRSRKRR